MLTSQRKTAPEAWNSPPNRSLRYEQANLTVQKKVHDCVACTLTFNRDCCVIFILFFYSFSTSHQGKPHPSRLESFDCVKTYCFVPNEGKSTEFVISWTSLDEIECEKCDTVRRV